MVSAEVINIIGITVYVLLSCFFWWVTNLTNARNQAKYFLLASIAILLGRIDLLLLSNWLPQSVIQTIYAGLLIIEKSCLILGLLYFFKGDVLARTYRVLITGAILSFSGIVIFNHLVVLEHGYPIWLAISQATYLAVIARVVLLNKHKSALISLEGLPILLVLYCLHWLTFPVAVKIDWYLPIGYFIGNVLNVILYFAMALMVLNRFKYHFIKAERAAVALAQEAMQASKAKSEFLANMSHEIRTPMNGVLGMLDLLQKSTLNTDQKEKVRIAHNSAKSLLAIINDILDFSKIEAGKLQIETTPSDLKALMEEIVSVMQYLAENKELELLADVTELPNRLIKTDPNRIRQVVVNLISNAVKFTEHGEVFIRAKVETDGHQTVFVCSVRDTGIGIAPEKIDHIFTSFQQADSSTTRHFGGTGLGLTISKNLCELMGGKITASSELGVGSNFEIEVPVTLTAQETEERPDFNGLQVLIVDDNPTSLEILDKQLSHWNISVHKANSASQATSLCDAIGHTLQLAIIDLQMPDGDGEQLGDLLKARPDTQHIPLVMISSVSGSELAQRMVAAGYKQFLVKPVLPTQLLSLLQHVTGQQNETEGFTASGKNTAYQWPENRILVVEDNEINQLVARELLKQLNLDCEVAIHGEDALVKLQDARQNNHPFTLILMDCQMPVLDGYMTTKLLRNGSAGDEYKRLPVIAMTANAMAGDKEQCIASGMDDYLTKPLDKTALFDALQKWL